MADHNSAPNLQSSAAAAINSMLEELASQFGAETIAELIDIYIKSSKDLLQKMEASFAAGDGKSLGELAHSLKSASANMGAHEFAANCKAIEHAKSADEASRQILSDMALEFPRIETTLLAWKTRRASAAS